jgi:hypothetical protein
VWAGVIAGCKDGKCAYTAEIFFDDGRMGKTVDAFQNRLRISDGVGEVPKIAIKM